MYYVQSDWLMHHGIKGQKWAVKLIGNAGLWVCPELRHISA